MRNNFSVKIESARAVCFILNDQGKMVGQASRWVIGGQPEPAPGGEKAGLAAGATNIFHFVVSISKPIMATNLTAMVGFNRVVLGGGGLADLKQVIVTRRAHQN
jgi:hypothetical protein